MAHRRVTYSTQARKFHTRASLKPKVSKATSAKEKASQAYPALARGLGHLGTFEDLPASAQAAYAQFVTHIIALHKGEEK